MAIGTKESARRARELLSQGNYRVPVNVKAIAKDLGIVVQEREFEDDLAGMLVVRGNHAVMGVNKKHSLNRRRFSIAHELGHYMMHRSMSDVFVDAFHRDNDSSKGIDPEEIQANAFAAEILMPETILRERLSRKPLDIFDEKSVSELAKEFGVSSQALTVRLTRLNLISA